MRRLGRIDHAGIEIEIEPGHVLAENSDVLAGGIEHAADKLGNVFSADAFHRNRRQRAGDTGVADQCVGLVTEDDLAGFGDRLQRAARFASAPMIV